MDIAGIQLLLAVLVVGISRSECWWWEITGAIINKLETTERYPWHKLCGEGSNDLQLCHTWNPAVKLEGYWENYISKFTLSCASITENGKDFHRAILIHREQGRSVMTWDVVSCDVNLLSSISVVGPQLWFGLFRNGFYIFTINQEKVCDGYFYFHKDFIQYKMWTIEAYQANKPHSCPAKWLWETSNSGLYKNGWKGVAIPENPQDTCKET